MNLSWLCNLNDIEILNYLVLHPGLDQVDGVDSCSTGCTSDGAQQETVGGLQHLDHHSSVLGTL